jgi:hypothetical protein
MTRRFSPFILLALLALAAPLRAAPGEAAAGLRLVRADDAGVVLELHTPEYELRRTPSGAQLRVAGYEGRVAAGLPELPYATATIALPSAAAPIARLVGADALPLALPAPLAVAPALGPNSVALGQRVQLQSVARPSAEPTSPVFVGRVALLRGQPFVSVTLFPFQPAGARGVLWRRSLRVELRFGAPAGAGAGAARDDGLASNIAINAPPAHIARAAPPEAAPPGNPCANAASLRLLVSEPGIYRLSRAAIEAAGLPVAGLARLHLYRGACVPANEVAAEEDGDGLRFYGWPSASRYAAAATYWLREEGAPGRRMGTRDAAPRSAPLQTSYTATVVISATMGADDQLRRPSYDWAYPGADGDHFFAGDVRFGRPLTFTLALPNRVAGPAALELVAQGLTRGAHRLALALNGAALPAATWGGLALVTHTLALPAASLLPETQRLVASVAEELPPDVSEIDVARVRYLAELRAASGRLLFEGAAGLRQYRVAEAGAAPLAYDVSDPLRPTRLLNVQAQPGGGALFADAPAAPARYALSAAGGELALGPGAAVRDTPSALAQGAADYLIVGYGPFLPAAEPLAAFYRARGLRVAAVDVQDIYDEWSGGALDPESIRAFARHAYANWSGRAPTYLLLVGDGSYDSRNLLGNGWANYVPPYFISGDPWTNEASCDTCYGRLDTPRASDDPLPELLVGRLPVSSLAQAEAVVAKTLAYRAAPAGAWQSRAISLSDNYYEADGSADPAGDFVASAERAIAALPAGFDARRFFYDPSPQRAGLPGFYAAPEPLRAALTRTLNEGAALLSYHGHSSYWQWAYTGANTEPPYLWYLYDADGLQNSPRLPVLLSMTCLTGFFQQPELPTTDERLLTSAGGIVASFSPSGLGVASGHDRLERAILLALFGADAQGRSLGAARLAADAALLGTPNGDLAYTYQLFGDPALALAYVPTSFVWLPAAAKR